MTPKVLRESLIDRCDLWPGMRVLDPGVGTGEFLRSVIDREPYCEIHGWDIDPKILAVAGDTVPEAVLTNRSALDPYLGDRFDLVIGNPPYFQLKLPKEVRAHFSQVISGRANIFALFFQVGLDLLRDGGQLAYVVPPSMNNGAYFAKLRDYIVRQCAIEFLEIYTEQSLFDQAQTPVQLLVLRKDRADSEKYSFEVSYPNVGFRRVIFSNNSEALADSFSKNNTLYSLGYEAVTGTIVWNQNKQHLKRTKTPSSVPLIWVHNIADTVRLVEDHKRPQYIETTRPVLTGPAIVVNRITGSVGSGELRCALIPEGYKFVGENHVNVIRRHAQFEASVGWNCLLEALRAPSVLARARMLTGNTQISATELTHLLPV